MLSKIFHSAQNRFSPFLFTSRRISDLKPFVAALSNPRLLFASRVETPGWHIVPTVHLRTGVAHGWCYSSVSASRAAPVGARSAVRGGARRVPLPTVPDPSHRPDQRSGGRRQASMLPLTALPPSCPQRAAPGPATASPPVQPDPPRGRTFLSAPGPRSIA